MHIGALISIASSIYAAMSANKAAEPSARTAAQTFGEQPSSIVSLSSQSSADGLSSPQEYGSDTYGQIYTNLGSGRSRAAALANSSNAAAAANSAITITPSGNGINGIDQTTPLLPNKENIAGLMEKATAQLGYRLDQAGIPRTPGFTLEIADPNTGRITVKGDHPNKDAIEQLANGDSSLRQTLQTANALSSHYAGMERGAAYQQEYQSAQNAQAAKISFNYDGRQAAVTIN
jgi:hypothetical protein